MEKLFNHLANATAKLAGRPWTFIVCLAVVLIWAVTGPVFRYSETWQLVINTGTTIVTFLMVFLIQNTQNRDAAAMHAKLDELVYAVKKADAGFIGGKWDDARILSLGHAYEQATKERRAPPLP